jgi:alkylation response protein AidB-like acyl-CoA dehydrogenase
LHTVPIQREAPAVNLELTDDQAFFRETTRRFIETETPMSAARELHDSDHGFDRRWWQSAAELGWTAMLASEEAGGGSLSGRPLTDAVIVAEEMGRMVTPGPFGPVNVVAAALSDSGGAAHGDVLAAIVSGASVAAWAYGEPGNRWDPRSMTTTIDVDGDTVVVSGEKAYVEAAPSADHLLVVGRTGDGLTQVLVPSAAEGVTVTAASSIDLGRRFGTVRLDGVRLPASAVVGEPGGAGDDVERQLEIALALQCADTVGGLDRVFEFTLEYMNDRFAFGRPIASYQSLKHRVADLLLMLESAKGCVDAAVRAFDDGDAEAAATEASVMKAFVADTSMHLIQECMQFHGGISVTWEHDIHLYLRRATVSRALLGSPEQHRERICSLLEVS